MEKEIIEFNYRLIEYKNSVKDLILWRDEKLAELLCNDDKEDCNNIVQKYARPMYIYVNYGINVNQYSTYVLSDLYSYKYLSNPYRSGKLSKRNLKCIYVVMEHMKVKNGNKIIKIPKNILMNILSWVGKSNINYLKYKF